MTSDAEAQEIVEALRARFRGDKDSGYALAKAIAERARRSTPAQRRALHGLLIDAVRRRESGLWGIALQALTDEPAPEVADCLADLVKGGGEPCEWRDQVVLTLLMLAHTAERDFYRSYVQSAIAAERPIRNGLLANFHRVDPNGYVELAAPYFAEIFKRADEITEGGVTTHVAVVGARAPTDLARVVAATAAIDSSAGKALADAILQYLRQPWGGWLARDARRRR